jgi:hypothetical protein
MGDNRHQYGFRWARAWNSTAVPPVNEVPVASGLAFTLNGGAACDINEGDPVTRLNTGYVTVCEGTENTALSALGIVQGIGNHGCVFDGTNMSPINKVVNGGGVYGTNFERQTKLMITPADAGYWELDCDDKTTATTYAAYLAFFEENVDIVLTAGSEPKLDPMIDISTHAVTATLKWRIVQVSDTMENKDFSGKYVKLIIKANVWQGAASTALGV